MRTKGSRDLSVTAFCNRVGNRLMHPGEVRLFLACGVLVALLGGCRAHAPLTVGAPPATTHEACRQIRDFFQKYHAASDAPGDMSAGCHMRIVAGDRVSRPLDRDFQARGWTRDPAYAKGAVPSAVAYETPFTRCTIEKLLNAGSRDGGVSGGIGIGGGSYLSTNFGLGIGLGVGSGNDTRVDYKIDCLPKIEK